MSDQIHDFLLACLGIIQIFLPNSSYEKVEKFIVWPLNFPLKNERYIKENFLIASYVTTLDQSWFHLQTREEFSFFQK